MLHAGLNWDELSAPDIRDILAAQAAGRPASTPLLDVQQWIPLAEQDGWIATGGFPGAQYRCLHQSSAQPAFAYWQAPAESLPIQARQARGLHKLLATQLPSGSLGDVIAAGGELYWITLPGPDDACATLGASPLPAWPELRAPVQRATAASPRLDAIASAIFHVSREETQTALEYGFVFHNFTEAAKRSKQVAAGDTVVFRGKGRAVIVNCELNPRSKRQWLDYELYPC
jgi:hypothetical protein